MACAIARSRFSWLPPATSVARPTCSPCFRYRLIGATPDFEREFQMALVNHKLNPGLDTMFLTAEHQFMYLSSSAVKELGRYDVALEDFLPAAIIPDFKARMAGQIGGGHNNG